MINNYILTIAVTSQEGEAQDKSGWNTTALQALAACTPLVAHPRPNDDWERISSPLIVSKWESGLQDHLDRGFAQFTCEGIRRGFRIGFNYRCKSIARNMRSVAEHEEVVENYIGAECRPRGC